MLAGKAIYWKLEPDKKRLLVTIKHLMNQFIILKTYLKRTLLVFGAIGVLLLLLVVLPALTFAPAPPAWVPEPVALWGFDMRLLIGRPLTNFSTLA